MSALDPKVLEAAYKVQSRAACRNCGEFPNSAWLADYLPETIQAAFDAADLVERTSCRGHASDCAVHNAPAYPPAPCDCGLAERLSLLIKSGTIDDGHWLAAIAHYKQERDEARLELDVTKKLYHQALDGLEAAVIVYKAERKVTDSQGKQLVALREALGPLSCSFHDMEDDDVVIANVGGRRITTGDCRAVMKLLADTAEAAAQWVRVPETSVVVSRGDLQFLVNCAALGPLEFAAMYGPDMEPSIPPEIEKLLAAAPKAGEGPELCDPAFPYNDLVNRER